MRQKRLSDDYKRAFIKTIESITNIGQSGLSDAEIKRIKSHKRATLQQIKKIKQVFHGDNMDLLNLNPSAHKHKKLVSQLLEDTSLDSNGDNDFNGEIEKLLVPGDFPIKINHSELARQMGISGAMLQNARNRGSASFYLLGKIHRYANQWKTSQPDYSSLNKRYREYVEIVKA